MEWQEQQAHTWALIICTTAAMEVPKKEAISGLYYRSSVDAWAGDEVVQIGLRHADTLVGCT